MRLINSKEYCHERLGNKFSQALSDYDTRRRVDILIHDFLAHERSDDKTALDVGCGLGFFSEQLHERGYDVVACDLGASLVKSTRDRVGCESVVADALDLVNQFGPASFDLVVSSECIEHTPEPYEAVRQMAAVLKPGGILSLSTPNIVWAPVVKAATLMGFRPFDGYENFSSWWGLRRTFAECGIEILREHGLHLFPFQLKLNQLSTWIDKHGQGLRFGMINMCLLGRKCVGESAAKAA